MDYFVFLPYEIFESLLFRLKEPDECFRLRIVSKKWKDIIDKMPINTKFSFHFGTGYVNSWIKMKSFIRLFSEIGNDGISEVPLLQADFGDQIDAISDKESEYIILWKNNSISIGCIIIMKIDHTFKSTLMLKLEIFDPKVETIGKGFNYCLDITRKTCYLYLFYTNEHFYWKKIEINHPEKDISIRTDNYGNIIIKISHQEYFDNSDDEDEAHDISKSGIKIQKPTIIYITKWKNLISKMILKDDISINEFEKIEIDDQVLDILTFENILWLKIQNNVFKYEKKEKYELIDIFSMELIMKENPSYFNIKNQSEILLIGFGSPMNSVITPHDGKIFSIGNCNMLGYQSEAVDFENWNTIYKFTKENILDGTAPEIIQKEREKTVRRLRSSIYASSNILLKNSNRGKYNIAYTMTGTKFIPFKYFVLKNKELKEFKLLNSSRVDTYDIHISLYSIIVKKKESIFLLFPK